ncbi:hypothetical protein [Myxacorys almedinensis]|uniref:Uncharacterized protein n=1 Tax=Myxacorys almedinensis A TaxID=2690445 RepID=A0A8J8CHD8_9CYAN|nr:hypothetical protein [Myxacorys almedinensis]NDJ16608.1 hypothetical protein [Myxacorys almedinensis A]
MPRLETHLKTAWLASQSSKKSRRLPWLEGIQIFAAVVILLYHAQLLFADYGYSPQPTGLVDNIQKLLIGSSTLGDGWLRHPPLLRRDFPAPLLTQEELGEVARLAAFTD